MAERIAQHGVSYHLFADDKQLYSAVPSDEIYVARQCLTSCIGDLRDWCTSRRLQLNASKTELIWFGTRTSLRRLSSADRTLMIDSVDVQPSDVVCDLDSELTLKHHINSNHQYMLLPPAQAQAVETSRRLRQLKRHVGVEVMRQLISCFIFSQLDYCNALLINLPFSTIAPLQRVQNTATRLLLGLPPCHGVTMYVQP